MAEKKLVFAYAYMLKNDLGLPKGLPGYFVGNHEEPFKGRWEGRNNWTYAVAKAAEESRDLSTFVDMNVEGLARDDRMVLLLQPTQEDPANYKSVNELIKKYLPDSAEIDPEGWQKQATIIFR